jgi:ribosome-associated protein
MTDHNTTDRSRAVEPTSKARKQITRNRSLRSMQDDVPHHATERRDPRRVSLALERSQSCARIADDNRAKDILLLDLKQITPLVDFFVIVTASSRRQGNAIASEIDAAMKKQGEAKLGLEGSEEGRWILIDYGDFVVHIFSPEYRAYYALEDIWGDAPQLDWQETTPSTHPPVPVPTRHHDERS